MTTLKHIAAIISGVTGVPAHSITPATRWNDIGGNSLDLVDVIVQAEAEFGVDISEDECDAVCTAGELAALVETKRQKVPA